MVEAMTEKVKKGEKRDIKNLNANIRTMRTRIKTTDVERPITEQEIAKLSKEEMEIDNFIKKAFTKKIIKQLQGQAREKLESVKPMLISKYLSERTSEDHGYADFIVSFNHPALFKFDLLVIALAIWNSIFIPLELAFEPPENPVIVLLNASIELVFMIDIGIAFRTSYLTFEGEEIVNPKKIAHRYILHGAFIFDLLSVIPFNLFTGGANLKLLDLLGILKLVHVTRLPHLVAKLNMGEETKAVRIYNLSIIN
jgi:Ion transport protein